MNRRISYGRTVHHIRPLKEYPELATAPDNLIFLSDKNHAEVHERMKKDFVGTVNFITKIKNKFREEILETI